MHLGDTTRKRLPWLLLAIGALITVIVYWPGTAGGWIFDDYPNILDNAAIHITPGHSTLAAWVNSAFSSPSSFLRRPLASITFSLNWYFSGGNPWSFKVTNIVIHVINGVLLFCMLRALLRLVGLRSNIRLTSRTDPQPQGGPIDESAVTRLALIVAVAWMLLPINLMAVLYVVQRMESLCQIFVLAGLWAYLHGRWMMLTTTEPSRDKRGFVLSTSGIVLGTLLGLTSKETAVLLPVFAFLSEWVVIGFGCREKSGAHTQQGGTTPTRGSRRIWALYIVTLFVPAILGILWLLRSVLNPASWTGRDFTLGQRLLTETRVLVDYLHWTLVPNPEVLSLYHDEIVKSTGLLAPWTTLGAIVLLVALLAAALWLRKRRPLVSLGILWFFAGNLLTATVIPLELVYEQRMYFPSIGVLLAAGSLLMGLRWKVSWGLLRGFLIVVALGWFAIVTNLRAQEWSNPLKLAVAEAARHPESPRAVYEAGRLLLIASNYEPGKMLDASKQYLRNAAAIPGSSSLADQALIMIADHHHQGADADYWRSAIRKLRTQPTRQEDVSALVSLTNCYTSGVCLFDATWLQRAYEAALSRPHPIPRLEGAYADFQRDILHNDALAEVYLARAANGDPSEPAYRIDLAALYAHHGQTALAEAQLRALRKLNYAGRLNGEIAALHRMVEQGGPPLKRE